MILDHDARFRLTSNARVALVALAALLLPLTLSLSAADPQPAEKVDPAQRTALLDAAMKTYRASVSGYEVGTVDIGQVHVWSRRWMDAESLGAPLEERREATQRHLARMEALLASVAELYKLGLKGGEAEKLYATEYFVAEARLLLGQLGRT